jgi:hypothetical protein
MDRRHFIGQSAAALGLVTGFSTQARANLQKSRNLGNWRRLWWRYSRKILALVL